MTNVLSLREDEKISSVIPVREFDAESYLIMATQRGLVKKTALEEYSRPKSGGIIGIALEDGDAARRRRPGQARRRNHAGNTAGHGHPLR